VFDRGYTLYVRFCKFKEADEDFITLLESDARYEVREHIQTVEVSDGDETRHVRDDRVELAETGEQFRRVLLETPDGEELEYLTTLASSAYDPIDVINIYTLRTVIEILFRELKQYLNIENFHSQTLNGVLFELFAAMIGMVLIEWLRQRHPMRGGVPDAITAVRDGWNETLRSVG
jgi:Transposase DDE domain.